MPGSTTWAPATPAGVHDRGGPGVDLGVAVALGAALLFALNATVSKLVMAAGWGPVQLVVRTGPSCCEERRGLRSSSQPATRG
jgi:hypothetical protein